MTTEKSNNRFMIYSKSKDVLVESFWKAFKRFPREERREVFSLVKKNGGSVGLSVDSYPSLDLSEYRLIESWLQRMYGRSDVRLASMIVLVGSSVLQVGVGSNTDSTEKIQVSDWISYPSTGDIASTRIYINHTQMIASMPHFNLFHKNNYGSGKQELAEGSFLNIPPRIFRAMGGVLEKEDPFRINLMTYKWDTARLN